MAILLDGRPVACPLESDQPLRVVLDALRREHVPDRIIVRIERDGTLLQGEALDAALAAPLEPQAQLTLTTEDPRSLVARALREVADSLRQAAGQSTMAADVFEQGDTAAAMDAIQPTLTPWRELQQVIQQAGALLGEPWLMQELDGQPLHVHLAALAGRLRDMRDALTTQDGVLLTDVLRYELPELAGQWAGQLERLASQTFEDPAADA